MHLSRNITFFEFGLACCLVQGCVPVGSGLLAYNAAILSQEHAAYTDYLFAMEAHNQTLRQEGKPAEHILLKAKWLKDIYKPKLAYADYYLSQTKEQTGAHPLMSYESWKETEYPKILKREEAQSQEILN